MRCTVVRQGMTAVESQASLFMRRNGKAVRQSMHEGLLGSMGVLSLLGMTAMRQILHKPIFKVFIHTLRDINPGEHVVAS